MAYEFGTQHSRSAGRHRDGQAHREGPTAASISLSLSLVLYHKIGGGNGAARWVPLEGSAAP